MTQDVLVTIVIALAAAAPGVVALVIGQRRETQRRELIREEDEIQDGLVAQLREQVAAQQKTILFLTQRVNELDRARKQEYEETEALRGEIEALRQENAELRRGVAALSRQIEEAQITPAWKPEERPLARKRPTSTERTALRRKIVEHFSLTEINDLAFELDIKADELEGSALPERARSLVRYLDDRGRLAELVELCRSQRPEAGF